MFQLSHSMPHTDVKLHRIRSVTHRSEFRSRFLVLRACAVQTDHGSLNLRARIEGRSSCMFSIRTDAKPSEYLLFFPSL
jgi:hypothetical protein